MGLDKGRYTRAMRWSFRRVFSLVLCVAVLFSGSGFASAYAGAIEHDLGIEASLGSPDKAPATGGEPSGVCDHGCAGHLTVHLLSIVPSAAFLFQMASKSMLEPMPEIRAVHALPNSFFRPPRLLLA
jgi:hypothetical protein